MTDIAKLQTVINGLATGNEEIADNALADLIQTKFASALGYLDTNDRPVPPSVEEQRAKLDAMNQAN